MFSGIVEKMSQVVAMEEKGTNIIFTMKEDFNEPLYIDQSLSHNGVCLTVIHIDQTKREYKVEAIKESLERSNLGLLQIGDLVNQERCIKMDTRMDGHIVSGHVDCTGTIKNISDENGSWVFNIEYPKEHAALIIDKGSITINGISLTVIAVTDDTVSVALIPYTFEHTNLGQTAIGDVVNLEFDFMGKYVVNYLKKIKM